MQAFRTGARLLGALAFVSATSLAAADHSLSAGPERHKNRDRANAVMEKKALLQSITRDACFKMAGVPGKNFGRRATFAIDTMYGALGALRERYQQNAPGARALDCLARIDKHWQILSPALQAGIGGGLPRGAGGADPEAVACPSDGTGGHSCRLSAAKGQHRTAGDRAGAKDAGAPADQGGVPRPARHFGSGQPQTTRHDDG